MNTQEKLLYKSFKLESSMYLDVLEDRSFEAEAMPSTLGDKDWTGGLHPCISVLQLSVSSSLKPH